MRWQWIHVLWKKNQAIGKTGSYSANFADGAWGLIDLHLSHPFFSTRTLRTNIQTASVYESCPLGPWLAQGHWRYRGPQESLGEHVESSGRRLDLAPCSRRWTSMSILVHRKIKAAMVLVRSMQFLTQTFLRVGWVSYMMLHDIRNRSGLMVIAMLSAIFD